jgi:hypothetical protein
MFDTLDECPINDDYKQRQLDRMEVSEKLHFDHQNKISAEAMEIALEEWVETGNVGFAKFVYFRHIHRNLKY